MLGGLDSVGWRVRVGLFAAMSSTVHLCRCVRGWQCLVTCFVDAGRREQRQYGTTMHVTGYTPSMHRHHHTYTTTQSPVRTRFDALM